VRAARRAAIGSAKDSGNESTGATKEEGTFFCGMKDGIKIN
jgi:hypothetical protein